ncbi:dienelactone hydrolase family protein [Piscinibacter sp. HJYY11]|uniref:dienelactone hydrolase family protein n=1 Tax=Piscinibacter sp. HJYY11 TaxID=2801333 RepID=UPI00191D1846|nr:dienelactone hydrolase family protein [Piscinibacter sp. HJYY11]MBL0727128.1 dienelactone hydrolase family protein [Piscinibacter sp. HJYY11]
MSRLRRLGGFVAALVCAAAARAESEVSFPSLDAPRGQAVVLKAYWHPVAAPKAPAIVLLHGCGGMHGRNGRPSERMRDYAQWLNGEGWHVLVVDSLTPRGERELCTQRNGERAITQTNRRLDAQAALQWLASRPEVDAKRLGLLGWSNGGSTVLAATNRKHRAVAAAAVQPSLAVAFYPGCESELRRGYEPVAPLLMLVGEADDWTPAAPCHRLAAGASQIEIEGYAGAYHGFDSGAPLRLRREVPNGVNPGQGVHVGGDAQAWAASRARLQKFLKAH